VELIFAPLAEDDLSEIWRHLAEQSLNRGVADRQIRRFFAVRDALCVHPFVGRVRDDLALDLRYLPIDDYVVFYRAGEHVIEIVRLLHASLDVAAFFE